MKTLVKTTVLAALAVSSLSTIAAPTNGTKYGDWEGVCQDKECYIVQLQYDSQKAPIAAIVLQKTPAPENKSIAVIKTQLGINLVPGVGLAIDGKEIGGIPYNYCDLQACNAGVPLEGELLSKLKAGKKLQVTIIAGNRPQSFEFSLKGITKAIDAL